MKYLVLFAILAVVYLVWRASERRAAQAESRRDAPPARGPQPPGLPQDMVRCPVCSVHLPKADALAGPAGRFYCSPEHRRLGGS